MFSGGIEKQRRAVCNGLNDICYFRDCNICNFADDTTHYACVKNLDFVLERLEQLNPQCWVFRNN